MVSQNKTKTIKIKVGEIMTLEVECDKTKKGIFITVDYHKGEMIIENNSGNNGDKPEVYTLEIGNFVSFETTGAEQNFHFKSESNGNSDDNLEDSVKEVEEEVVSDGVSTEVESEIINDDVLIKTESEIIDDGTSVEIEPETISNDIPIETEVEIAQDSNLADIQISDDSIETIETDPDQNAISSVTIEELKGKDSEFVFLTRNEIRILAALLAEKEGLGRDEISTTDVSDSHIPNALKELEDSGLIYYENDGKLIKPNLEKASVSCLWLYDSKIQKIVRSDFSFRLGRSVQKVLHLLYNYPDGLCQDVIIASLGFSKPTFKNAIATMEGYGLIRVTGKRNETVIFPKFSANQAEKDLITSQKSVVAETDIVEVEESVANSDADREDLSISQRPTAVETISDQKVATEAKSTAAINTAEGFNVKNFESYVDMIFKGSVVKLQTLSSRFGVRLRDEGVTKLLNAIDKRIAIEVVNVRTGKIVSWEPKQLKGITVYFEGIAFGNLEIRRKANNSEEEDIKIKDSEEQGMTLALGVDSIESVNDEIIKGEQKKEDVVKKIKGMIATQNLGDPHKKVLTILLNNYLNNNSLKMEIDDLMDNASNQNLGEVQVRSCFGGLLALKFIKKPNKIIELNIKT